MHRIFVSTCGLGPNSLIRADGEHNCMLGGPSPRDPSTRVPEAALSKGPRGPSTRAPSPRGQGGALSKGPPPRGPSTHLTKSTQQKMNGITVRTCGLVIKPDVFVFKKCTCADMFNMFCFALAQGRVRQMPEVRPRESVQKRASALPRSIRADLCALPAL